MKNAVYLDLLWRRHDRWLERKKFIIVHAETGDTIQNIHRIKVENESEFTINGLMTMLTDLGEQQIPLAILRFNDQYGIPEAITTNSDESPILRMVRVESFEPIAD